MRMLGQPYHLLLIGGAAPPSHDHRITRMPFCRDPRVLARLLGACDMLVHPGDCETFGLIVLEAMACGLPVVVTGGAVAELVDERNGIVVPPDSAATLAQGIAALYERDLPGLGAASRDKARQQYDWNRIMPQLLQRYAGLLGQGCSSDIDMASLHAACHADANGPLVLDRTGPAAPAAPAALADSASSNVHHRPVHAANNYAANYAAD